MVLARFQGQPGPTVWTEITYNIEEDRQIFFDEIL